MSKPITPEARQELLRAAGCVTCEKNNPPSPALTKMLASIGFVYDPQSACYSANPVFIRQKTTLGKITEQYRLSVSSKPDEDRHALVLIQNNDPNNYKGCKTGGETTYYLGGYSLQEIPLCLANRIDSLNQELSAKLAVALEDKPAVTSHRQTQALLAFANIKKDVSLLARAQRARRAKKIGAASGTVRKHYRFVEKAFS